MSDAPQPSNPLSTAEAARPGLAGAEAEEAAHAASLAARRAVLNQWVRRVAIWGAQMVAAEVVQSLLGKILLAVMIAAAAAAVWFVSSKLGPRSPDTTLGPSGASPVE